MSVRRTLKITAILGLMVFNAMAFNNCTKQNVGSSASESRQASGDGGAYDGKTIEFNRYDSNPCSGQTPEGARLPNGTIQVSGQPGAPSFAKIRENCSAITPQPLPAASVSVRFGGLIVHNDQSYIAETENTLSPLGYTVGSPNHAKVWGPARCFADDIGGSNIGNANSESQRFRAPESGLVTSVRTLFGAGAGDGGTVRVRIFPDDGSALNRPLTTGAPLAQGTYVPNLNNGAFVVPSNAYAEIPMTATTPLVAGQLYHVVYDNLVNSAVRWVILNSQLTGLAHGRPCRATNPIDWAQMRYQTTGLYQYEDMTSIARDVFFMAPILQVRTASGGVFGSSNVQAIGNSAGQEFIVRAGQPVRERIQNLAAHPLAHFSIHTAASVPGNLTWSLKDGAATLASGTINQAAANYRTGLLMGGPSESFFQWYDITLPSVIGLQAGRIYDLEFSVNDASVWMFAAQIDGSNLGFLNGPAFTESRAETGDGAGNWTAVGPGGHWRLLMRDQ